MCKRSNDHTLARVTSIKSTKQEYKGVHLRLCDEFYRIYLYLLHEHSINLDTAPSRRGTMVTTTT